jgi:hypothetical protein
MPPSPFGRLGFLSLRSIFLLFLAITLPAFRARAQVIETILIPENSFTITLDPMIQPEPLTLRLAEAVVPPPPSFEVVGFNTQLASLLVQQNAMGQGWYELRIEQEVLTALLELHGLAPDQRSRMLRWERDEVRGGLPPAASANPQQAQPHTGGATGV